MSVNILKMWIFELLKFDGLFLESLDEGYRYCKVLVIVL